MNSGESDLKELLKHMEPVLNDGAYVFISTLKDHSFLKEKSIFTFKESEGTTLIIEKKHAEKLNYKYNFVAAWITLKVHSNLDAVGLTAVFSSALAKNQISCNVIAAFYHDHIFVDYNKKDQAIKVLNNIMNNNR